MTEAATGGTPLSPGELAHEDSALALENGAIEYTGGHSHVAPARTIPDRVLVPVISALTTAALSQEPYEGLVIALMAFSCAALLVPPRPAWAALLPLMRAPLNLLMPALGTLLLVAVHAATSLPGMDSRGFAIVLGVSCLAALAAYASSRGLRRKVPVRVAVIAAQRPATDLARELALVGRSDYAVVGRIAPSPAPELTMEEVPTIGALGGLAELIEHHRINLLLMTSEAPRSRVFDELSTTCLHLPVRLWELSSFYEDVFGHVPVAEINAAWFQYIMHPKYRAVAPASKRAVDIAIASVTGLAFMPLLAVLALIIRRDGGPVFFKQTRIGEGGRPLVLHKLRTMRAGDEVAAQWASSDDPRVTTIGRLLRRAHLDELPQLLNVLRGEMSLVGPRPEQPEFVARLEEVLPFYQRRHLLKPGLTGWAQVRCGYAGSDMGSAWKLSHDLYYLKHRTMAFDLAILGETFRTLFADRRYSIEAKWVPFIHGYDPLPPLEENLPAAGLESDPDAPPMLRDVVSR